MINRKSMAKRAAQVGIISALTLSVAFSASAEDKAYKIDVADIPLNEALIQFTIQSQWQFLSPQKLLKGKKATAVKGIMSRDKALKQLLKGTGLDYIIDDKGQVLIVPAHSKDISSINSKNKNIQIASASYMSDKSNISSENFLAEENNSASDETEEEAEEYMEEVTTTGSHIRGVGAVGSKVVTVDREEIDIQGYSTVTEFIQSLPQNFNGGISESTFGLSFDNGASDSSNQGTGINLRGLGNASTLVLLNGQRLAPSGTNGGFVDISMIPLTAVDRVEVLTDGASAIYGSDAIGGVVNFKLRKDYNGAETRLRYGLATQGGLEEITVGQTFGKVWDQAHGLISFEYNHRNPLSVKDRSFSKESSEFITLLGEQERRNVFLTGGFEATENLEVFTTAYYTLRNSQQVDITGFTRPPMLRNSRNQHFGGTLGSTWDLDNILSNEWQMELVGSFSQSEVFTRRKELDQADSDSQIINRITESLSTDAKLNGSLFNMPGGDAKLAIGGHFRRDSFGGGDVSGPGRVVLSVTDQSRDIYALFGEVYLPFVGADNRMPGVERLEMSISARYEHYSDFGSSTDPKFGVVWSPIDGLNLRGTYGTSFRAPLLAELDESGNVALLFPPILANDRSPTGTSSLLLASGKNAALQPETAAIWTAGFDFQPNALPGLTVGVTYFNINYKDRISEFTLSFTLLNDPAIAPFINFDGPDADFLTLIENYQLINIAGTDIADVDVAADLRLQNIGRNNITGLDFSVLYALDTVDAGSWNFSMNGSYIFDYIVQATETSPDFDEVGTTGRPVNLRLNAGLFWSYEGFTTNITVNYVDSYLNDQIEPNAPVDSWTTINLTLSYDTGDRFGGWMEGAVFSLSALNLFNQDPPFIEAGLQTNSRIFYDPNAANPRGRVLSFQITKQW